MRGEPINDDVPNHRRTSRRCRLDHVVESAVKASVGGGMAEGAMLHRNWQKANNQRSCVPDAGTERADGAKSLSPPQAAQSRQKSLNRSGASVV
jgi:hypothetical protein